MSDAEDDAMKEAARAGLPVNLRRRVNAQTPSSAPEAKGDPASSRGTTEPPGAVEQAAPGGDPEDEPEIESLDWVDGRLVLVKEPAAKGRTREEGPEGPDQEPTDRRNPGGTHPPDRS